MSRTADEKHRAELLERICDYVAKHGVADLSLRPLAQAVRSSPRVLLYYFESKEQLIVEVLESARSRQRALFGKMRLEADAEHTDICIAIWSVMSSAKSEPLFRLFFEVYALALQDPQRFAGFLDRAVDDWLAFLEGPLLRKGYKRADARAIATMIVAAFRGFMLDLCATHDRKRIGRAFELWLQTLDHLPQPKGVAA